MVGLLFEECEGEWVRDKELLLGWNISGSRYVIVRGKEGGAASAPVHIVSPSLEREIESSGFSDSLSAALYTELATDIVDVFLDGVHTED